MTTTAEDDLIAQIAAAFDKVQLDDGVSLNMAEFNDSGGSAAHFAEQAKSDERVDWHRVITPALEAFTVTFCFTDLKGFRFYIPAYMIWTIRNHRISNSIITDNTIYAIDPDRYLFREIAFTKWFSPRQVAAMIAFLEYCVVNNDSVDGEIAAENLRKIIAQCGPS